MNTFEEGDVICQIEPIRIVLGDLPDSPAIHPHLIRLASYDRKKLNTEASFTEGLMRCGTWAEEADRKCRDSAEVVQERGSLGFNIVRYGVDQNPVGPRKLSQYQQLFISIHVIQSYSVIFSHIDQV